ncbi:hypothetical protein HD806DRAFT_483003 [Xylariaceae sp. AK1471]|nr:hypothetical protein HD806DRAFT_483003 [Xylariaceae sp. AK1471]
MSTRIRPVRTTSSNDFSVPPIHRGEQDNGAFGLSSIIRRWFGIDGAFVGVEASPRHQLSLSTGATGFDRSAIVSLSTIGIEGDPNM